MNVLYAHSRALRLLLPCTASHSALTPIGTSSSKNVSKEKTFHSCQIPEKLSELLIKACTEPGDVVFIPFGGSGAEISVCLKTGRRFVAAEIDPTYYQMILDRIALEGGIDRKYRLIERIRARKLACCREPSESPQLRMLQERGQVASGNDSSARN